MLALLAGTLVGIVGTLAAGSEPGFLLGFFITLSAIVGTLGVRRGAIYLFFPLPPIAFFVAGLITGKVHDSGISSTTVGLFASLPQWIADIFFPMCVATILVLLVGGIRWGLGLMVVGGQFPMSDPRSAGPRSPRPRTAPGPRTDVDPWSDHPSAQGRQAAVDAPRAANQSRPRPNSDPWQTPDDARSAPSRPARPARDGRDDRDPWGDPRPGPASAARPPTRNAPPAAPTPTFRPRPAKPASPPGDRAARPPAPPRPVRPPTDSRDQGY